MTGKPAANVGVSSSRTREVARRGRHGAPEWSAGRVYLHRGNVDAAWERTWPILLQLIGWTPAGVVILSISGRETTANGGGDAR